MATVSIDGLRLSSTVRGLVPSMYGAVRRGISANQLQRDILAAGLPAGSRAQFLRAFNAVRTNVASSAGLRYTRGDYAPGLHPTSLIPTRLNTIHGYQAVVEVRGSGGARRVITIGYDDPSMTKQDIVDNAIEIAATERYSAFDGTVPATWDSGVLVEVRMRGASG